MSMWESDHKWLPFLFAADARQFHGVLPYDGLEPLSDDWKVSRW